MSTKVLYNKMFKTSYGFIPATGEEFISFVETKSKEEALDILSISDKRRCPFCYSDKCLSEIRRKKSISLSDEELYALPEAVIDVELGLAQCRKFAKYFLVEKRVKGFSDKEGQCPWCGSTFTEPLPDGTHSDSLGMPFIVPNPEQVKKHQEELTSKHPYRCKHCSRMFAGNWYIKQE